MDAVIHRATDEDGHNRYQRVAEMRRAVENVLDTHAAVATQSSATFQTPFYSDPSLVTFHHLVEFLNEIADKVTVEEDMIKDGDSILAYIGDGDAAAGQIVYQNGRFRLGNAQWAARPVVRVTWLGAEAYARHYGKRLPTLS